MRNISLSSTQGVYTRESAEYQAAVNARIQPVGDVYLPGEEQHSAAPTVETVAEPEPVAVVQSGPQVYNVACNVCHGNGVGGAPIVGEVDAWTARIAQGNDMLYQHAIEGFAGDAGFMPAKGGNMSLSDEEVIAAVGLHGRGIAVTHCPDQQPLNPNASAICGGVIRSES